MGAAVSPGVEYPYPKDVTVVPGRNLTFETVNPETFTGAMVVTGESRIASA